MNIFNDDDAFVGTPKSNYFSIAKTACRDGTRQDV